MQKNVTDFMLLHIYISKTYSFFLKKKISLSTDESSIHIP